MSWVYTLSSVQSLSRVRLFVTPWTAARQAALSITNSQSLLKPMSIELVMPSNHLILCRSLLLPLNLSQHMGLFHWVSSSHQVAKVLEFQLQHQSFQWIFRTDFRWDGLVGSPCSPRDSQESPQTPQFKSINSSAHTSYKFIQWMSVCQNISCQNDNWQLWFPSLQTQGLTAGKKKPTVGFMLGFSNRNGR